MCLGFGLIATGELALRLGGHYTLKNTPPQLPDDWKENGIQAAGTLNASLLTRQGERVSLSGRAQGYMKTPPFDVVPEAKRIFSFGGSATLGVPVENQPEQTFPGQLHQQLEQLGVSNESINLGGASFGSNHVKDLAIEIKDLSPSALLIYSGNNEYFNFGLALSEQHRHYQPGSVYLQSLHLFRMLSHLLGKRARTAKILPNSSSSSKTKNLLRSFKASSKMSQIQSSGTAAKPLAKTA